MVGDEELVNGVYYKQLAHKLLNYVYPVGEPNQKVPHTEKVEIIRHILSLYLVQLKALDKNRKYLE